MNHVLALALAIGFVAGLRSMIAPAAVAWAAHLGWIDLQESGLRWMGSTTAVVIISLMAAGELLGDKMVFTPKRTSPVPLFARILTGAFSGLCLTAAAHQSLFAGPIAGSIGSLAGAFAGYHIRRWLVTNLRTRDVIIAIAEDLITIGTAIFVVSRGFPV
jgi:uncharacterized membrane protein